MAVSVLIVEDDRNIAELLQMYLEKEGYAVTLAADGGQGLTKFRSLQPDLVLLDVMMPVMDGWSVCKSIRAESQTPIIMLTAKGETDDKVNGLRSGADDYVVFPCSPLELLARVKAHIRRYDQLLGADARVGRIYRIQDLVVNDMTKSVTVADREVKLTPIEYKILKLLMQEKGRVLSTPEIYESIWNMRAIGADNTIAVHVRHIREKIEENPKRPAYLKVVWGTGYKVG